GNRTYNLFSDHVTDDIPALSFNLSSRALFPLKTAEDYTGAAAPADTAEHWYNRLYGSYGANAIVKRDVYNNHSQPGFLQSGMTQSAELSLPTTIFNYFTISPNFSARLSTFDAYMDTGAASIKYIVDTTYDTVRLTSWQQTNATIIDTIISTKDTQYVRRTISAPRAVPFYENATHDFKNVPSWNAGVSLSTNLYGLFPIKLFNFAGIRHTLTPSLSFNYTPKHDLANQFFPLGIPYDGPHPQSRAVGLSLGNSFQGKIVTPGKTPEEKPAEQKFTIVSGSISTGYDFEAEKLGKRGIWSPLNVSASSYYNFASFSYNSSYWLYGANNQLTTPQLANYTVTITTPALGAGGSLWDGDRIVLDKLKPPDSTAGFNALSTAGGLQQWSFSMSPSYTFSQSRTTPQMPFVTNKQYNLSAGANFKYSRIWSASWNSYYNFVTNQLVGHTLGFYCDLECWEMRFNWTPSGYNPGYYFLIDIKKIPEIKWEKKQDN
ncbi:MAG: putative LPS assembly protein LptD, partial [Chitinivibrionales bacterium]|nr:putative LPS assembly protein LptD [Chitinivibrionales bacterium]